MVTLHSYTSTMITLHSYTSTMVTLHSYASTMVTLHCNYLTMITLNCNFEELTKLSKADTWKRNKEERHQKYHYKLDPETWAIHLTIKTSMQEAKGLEIKVEPCIGSID